MITPHREHSTIPNSCEQHSRCWRAFCVLRILLYFRPFVSRKVSERERWMLFAFHLEISVVADII